MYKVCILWPAYISDEKLQCMKRKNKAWRGKKKTVAETHYDFVNLSAGMEEEKEVLYFPRFETFFFPLFFLDLTVAFSRKFTFCRGKKSKLGREGKKKKTIREEKERKKETEREREKERNNFFRPRAENPIRPGRAENPIRPGRTHFTGK